MQRESRKYLRYISIRLGRDVSFLFFTNVKYKYRYVVNGASTSVAVDFSSPAFTLGDKNWLKEGYLLVSTATYPNMVIFSTYQERSSFTLL